MQAMKNLGELIKEKAGELADSARKLSRFQIGIIIVLLMALLVSAGVNYYRSRPVELKINEPHERDSDQGTRKVIVHVAGLVNKPGLYELEEGSRIADAIGKAGGVKPEAYLDGINLAAKLEDGNQIVIPSAYDKSQSVQGGESSGNNGELYSRININTATADELDGLPGIGPSYADRIIKYRKENGPFSSVEQLEEIKGIGPSVLEEIRDMVTI